MISPHSEQSFLDTYWEKKPVILKRDQPEYWEGLMSLQNVEAMKESADIVGRSPAPFKRGVPELPDYDDAFDAYLDGASLVMNQADKVRAAGVGSVKKSTATSKKNPAGALSPPPFPFVSPLPLTHRTFLSFRLCLLSAAAVLLLGLPLGLEAHRTVLPGPQPALPALLLRNVPHPSGGPGGASTHRRPRRVHPAVQRAQAVEDLQRPPEASHDRGDAGERRTCPVS
jgi:hypothetical protein